MNEIELFEKIENSIHEGTYNEFLNDTEKELCNLLSRYTVEDIMILINKVIIFHNYNMYCKENDYSKYQRNKHISLKMLLALPQYYYANISVRKNNHITNYEMVMDELLQKLVEIQLIYYYYPYRNERNFIFNDKTQFYMNYFKAYYFDYPCIEVNEFISFFYNNIELCGKVLGDNTFKESLYLMCYLQEIETNFKKEKFWFKLMCSKNIKGKIDLDYIWILYPTKMIRRICHYKKIDFEKIIQNYAFSIENNTENAMKIIDVLAMQKENRFMMMTSKFIFFPRNYFWMYRWYNKVWRSNEMSQKLINGKTVKSQMHEEELYALLKHYFGEKNVFANAYLKRLGRQFAEKDFIVLYENIVLSFEAKSNLLPVPELDVTDKIDDIKSKCEECIKKAYNQSLEVKQAIIGGTAIFYDSSNKKNKVLLDLTNIKVDKCIQIVVMYEEFLGIETNVEQICPEFDAWITDVKNLMYILADTVGRGDFDTFVDYALKRKNAYGLVDVQSGEELKIYNLYKSFPFFFEHNYNGRGISVHI